MLVTETLFCSRVVPCQLFDSDVASGKRASGPFEFTAFLIVMVFHAVSSKPIVIFGRISPVQLLGRWHFPTSNFQLRQRKQLPMPQSGSFLLLRVCSLTCLMHLFWVWYVMIVMNAAVTPKFAFLNSVLPSSGVVSPAGESKVSVAICGHVAATCSW